GALALIALGGTAAAVANRRRRRREQEQADRESMSFEPFEAAAAPEPKPAPAIHREQPAIAATSAFDWGNRAQAREELHAKELCPIETTDVPVRPGLNEPIAGPRRTTRRCRCATA